MENRPSAARGKYYADKYSFIMKKIAKHWDKTYYKILTITSSFAILMLRKTK